MIRADKGHLLPTHVHVYTGAITNPIMYPLTLSVAENTLAPAMELKLMNPSAFPNLPPSLSLSSPEVVLGRNKRSCLTWIKDHGKDLNSVQTLILSSPRISSLHVGLFYDDLLCAYILTEVRASANDTLINGLSMYELPDPVSRILSPGDLLDFDDGGPLYSIVSTQGCGTPPHLTPSSTPHLAPHLTAFAYLIPVLTPSTHPAATISSLLAQLNPPLHLIVDPVQDAPVTRSEALSALFHYSLSQGSVTTAAATVSLGYIPSHPIHAAAAIHKDDPQLTTFMLEHQTGADINQLDSDGCTPLMIAARANHIQIATALLDAGADPSFALAPAVVRSLSPDMITLLHAPLELVISSSALSSEPDLLATVEHEGAVLERLRALDLSDNALAPLPLSFFQACTSLSILNLGANGLTDADLAGPFPPHFLPSLSVLALQGNRLTRVPVALLASLSVTELVLSNNDIVCVSEESTQILAPTLTRLSLDRNYLDHAPHTLSALTLLEYLNLSGWIGVSDLEWVRPLTRLRTLILDGAPVVVSSTGVLESTEWSSFVTTKPYDRWLDQDGCDYSACVVFDKMDANRDGSLQNEAIQALNAHLMTSLAPRSVSLAPLLDLPALESLSLRYLGLETLPSDLFEGSRADSLTSLNISHNRLVNLPVSIGGVASLDRFDVSGNPLNFPPSSVRERGSDAVLLYLQSLAGGSVPISRTKLLFVGLGNAGKSCLISSLTADGDFDPNSKSTDGITISKWASQGIEFSVWDFAGQSVYATTHEFFLSSHAIYILVWNIRLGAEHAGIDFWLNSIRSHHPNAPCLIVGTHTDQVPVSNIEERRLTRQFSQIREFINVSSATGHNIDYLRSRILETAASLPYMDQSVPTSFIKLEGELTKLAANAGKDLITDWDSVRAVGATCTLHEDEELARATQFLSDLGTVIHVQTPALMDLVILSPQFLADVMACVVSAQLPKMDHDSSKPVVSDGILYVCDTSIIWSQYEPSLHPKLLKLIEQFELAFALVPDPTRGPRLMIPCLLPDDPIPWPQQIQNLLATPAGESEFVFYRYQFDFLPIGLFARIQVRSRESSQSASSLSLFWKTGARIKRGAQLAELRTDQRAGVIVVAVRGPAPRALMASFSDIISRLVDEAYGGLEYQVHVPCSACIGSLGLSGPDLATPFVGSTNTGESSDLQAGAGVRTLSPATFLMRTIRRAQNSDVPFLQCSYFHMVAVRTLITRIPPKSDKQVADQFEHDLRALEEQKTLVNSAIYLSYSMRNSQAAVDAGYVPAATGSMDPVDLADTLRACGFTVYMRDPRETENPGAVERDMAAILQSVRIFVPCISVEYFSDTTTLREYEYALKVLHKSRVPIVVGSGFGFLDSPAYMIMSGELWIDFATKATHQAKLEEFTNRLRMMLPPNQAIVPYVATPNGSENGSSGNESSSSVPRGLAVDGARPVFLSYAWRNSPDAMGSKAVSCVDPRAIARELHAQFGLGVWLDIDCLGRGGLFEDIAAGLAQAAIVVACVSDAYAGSDNCRMEFLHATKNLGLPVLIALVGDGDYEWTQTEVGMISAGYPKYKFSVSRDETQPSVLEDLGTAIVSKLSQVSSQNPQMSSSEGGASASDIDVDVESEAWRELVYQAQRSFIRQLVVTGGHAQAVAIRGPRVLILEFPSVARCDDDDDGAHSEEKKGSLVEGAVLTAMCESPSGWHALPDGPRAVLDGKETTMMTISVASQYFGQLLRLLRILDPSLSMVRSSEFSVFVNEGQGKKAKNDPSAGVRPRARSHSVLSHCRQQKDVRSAHGLLFDLLLDKGEIEYFDDGGEVSVLGDLQRVTLVSGERLWLCSSCRSHQST